LLDGKEDGMGKIIGISGNLAFMPGGMFPGYGKAYVNDDYVTAVEAVGGVPLILPVIADEEHIAEQLSVVDAVIISGGWDVDPLLWGEEPHEKLGETLPQRDAFDLALIAQARRQGLPILGICRGIQILNVAAGGTLYQDISEQPGSFVRHWQKSHPAQATHTVELQAGSELYELLGGKATVNSFHHMAVHEAAPGYRVTARAADQTIEGLEAVDGSPVLAVQWHPEMMQARAKVMQGLFRWLLK
jgi:putative glutamine amidotransferase